MYDRIKSWGMYDPQELNLEECMIELILSYIKSRGMYDPQDLILEYLGNV